MSSSMPIQHFTHIHPLTKVDGHHGFLCNGCNTYGFGTTYRCFSCNYDLHDHCATCPLTLPSFMHPQHGLQRVFRGPDEMQQNRCKCNICDELVEGLYYHCDPCDFDVHPLCTKLPQHVRHVPHPDHQLELSHSGASNMCQVCRGAIRSWRYKCGLCRIDVHMECVKSSVTAGGATQERYIVSPPQFHHSHNNQPYHTQVHHPQYYNPYNTQLHHSQYHHPHYTQFQHHGYTNQGQFQQNQLSNPSMRISVFEILMTLTLEIANHIIDDVILGSGSDAPDGSGSNSSNG